jgi:6,7-dimethyl-8-ribityllumazine synthase
VADDPHANPHVMIVEARFYDDIADAMFDSVKSELDAAKATYERVQVPGSFEIPAAIMYALRSLDFYTARRRFDGYIALGCVIRGETSHYDHVCQETSRALQDLAVQYSLALGFGLLTCENRAQAVVRARRDGKDRAGAAARACLRMIELKRQFRLYPR